MHHRRTQQGRHLAAITLSLALGLMTACSTPSGPGVSGVYETWDDVIERWIGQSKDDLIYELGPPNLEPVQQPDGMTELTWDLSIDRMPGQADVYGLLPLMRGQSCRLFFWADPQGVVRAGKHVGCG